MLNQSIIMGRLTKDPEIKYFANDGGSVTRFSVAVERDYKAQGEEKPKTDFINCIAWNRTGEFIDKYFRKGSMIAVVGSIETGSYKNQEGKTVYTTEVRVNKASFTGERTDNNNNAGSSQPVNNQASDDFMDIPDGIDEELPFN